MTTTALVALAGAATAEITVTGTAGFGLQTTEGTAAVAAGANGKATTQMVTDATAANGAAAVGALANDTAATADDLPIPRGLGIVGTRLLSRSGGSADHRYQQGDGSAEDEFPLHDSTSLYPDLADKDALLRSTGATGTAVFGPPGGGGFDTG